MGDFQVRAIQNTTERNKFYQAILSDITKFEKLISDGRVDPAQNMIGAEQEICIIDKNGRPSPKALEFLATINDNHFTNELALFNLEINSDPMLLGPTTFRQMEDHLLTLHRKGEKNAQKYYCDLFLTGVLPTLKYRHLHFSLMTPENRYQVISNEMLRLRGQNFNIHVEGVDELYANLDNVLFEACNTSFQTHLQVNPHNFRQTYNWSQMISGPVLAACTNSPMLFGKELWHENRITLFKQSLDTRTFTNPNTKRAPRVFFGSDWLQDGAPELWKNLVTRFPLLLMGEDTNAEKDETQTPLLRSIRLMNGTTYSWNRLCYGVHNDQAHIRIECRYLPAGPTIVDEVANLAFWVGLMQGLPEELHDFEKRNSFKLAKDNFIRAARTGLHSYFNWFGKYMGAQELIEKELIPMAAKGLEKYGVGSEDISYYLGIISDRVASGQTGSEWSVQNHRLLSKNYKPAVCDRILVEASLQHQKENKPVHQWEQLNHSASAIDHKLRCEIVEDVMNIDVHTINENSNIGLARTIMEWKGFHHLVVENDQNKITGIFSASQMESLDVSNATPLKMKDKMSTQVITINSHESIATAQEMLNKHKIRCLPVMENGSLVGIITDKDLISH